MMRFGILNSSSSNCEEKATVKELNTSYSEEIQVLSLFSGCGGLDLGFVGAFEVPKVCVNDKDFIEYEADGMIMLKKNPFKIAFCNDIMHEAKKVYQANLLEEINYEVMSVSLLNGKDLPKADLIIGGFPCQDFSIAGKRKGFAAERGRLYQEMSRVIGEVKPKAFVAENVFGLLSLEGALEEIVSEFSKNGYQLFYYPIEAQHYGVPQMRKRIFFIGLNKDCLKRNVREEELLPTPTHRDQWVNLNEIIGHLDEPSMSTDPDQQSYSRAKFYGSNCQGNKAIDMNKPAPTIRAEHHGNIEFRRLENKGHGQDRRLSVREVALIQTFPQNFKFTAIGGQKLLSQTSAYKVIGNAVPPLLAYHFARNLGNLWQEIF